MRWIVLALRRLAVGLLGVVGIWLIAFVFRLTDQRLPTLLSLALAYGVAAYVILPQIVLMKSQAPETPQRAEFHAHRRRVPGRSGQSRPRGHARRASRRFRPRGLDRGRSARPEKLLGHGRVLRPEPALSVGAVSSLYLFGRKQDVGFEKAIDKSPRKRHHVRFWALNPDRAAEANTPKFWLNADRPPLHEPALWVGAGTRDTGLSFTKFTFQFTHATDADTNAERDFILGELKPRAPSASRPGTRKASG